MPSAKPDKALLKAAIRDRYGWHGPDDIFTSIQDSALMAIADGCISPPRAAQLEFSLLASPEMDFFPYGTLQRALTNALQHGGWTPEAERDLLVLISAVFSESDPLIDSCASLVREEFPTLGDIYPQLFDTPPPDFSLAGKFCDFTGQFAERSRRQCYEVVTAKGGIPSDGGWYTDCFFVANDHYDNRVVSNGLAIAISSRALHGITRIYREDVFPG
ncbi:hypothetical protein FQZ97_577160 [compost metagenome]